MSNAKPPKKNGSIEIRLPDEAKAAFMARCRLEQHTASEAIRAFINAEIGQTATPPSRRTGSWRIIAAGVAGAVLGIGAAAPSLAHAAQTTRAAFDQLDTNHDGVLSYREFRAR